MFYLLRKSGRINDKEFCKEKFYKTLNGVKKAYDRLCLHSELKAAAAIKKCPVEISRSWFDKDDENQYIGSNWASYKSDSDKWYQFEDIDCYAYFDNEFELEKWHLRWHNI